MRKIIPTILLIAFLLCACVAQEAPADIAATTLPVYEFTCRITQGTPLTVARLVTQSVSCLHDYSLDVRQVKAVEASDVVIISGAGLEEFMEDILAERKTIDASVGVTLLAGTTEHDHGHEASEHTHEDAHTHEQDPHIWLSPAIAKTMAENISAGLCAEYPTYADIFASNLNALLADLDALLAYGEETLSSLSCCDLVTFHDGFGYFADCFGLSILEAVEEESGSEASAQELIHLIEVTRAHALPAIFTETNGSTSAADVIARETLARVFSLDMAMSGDSYFDAMYHNIDTIKEAMG